MMLTLLDKQTLQLINRRTLRYTLVAAEKDYFLTLALKVLSQSSLFSTLVFKGGTAIHHCYLPQSRFSEDLDFTSLDKSLTAEDLTAIFAGYPFFEVKKLYTSPATIKIERLRYSGVLDLPNSLKFEVDRLQSVVLPAQQLPYANVWGIDVTVNVMDIREICAEKIRAMSERARYRDFYDFYLMTQTHQIDLSEAVQLLQQKEMRKALSKASILRNWQMASAQRREEIDLVSYQHDLSEGVEELLDSLPFETLENNH
ncbi:MAG: nucleotidyl transferase AbiEii/AbiGii toxin family protein [Caldilineaceae bacterium]|nr:nucleotidyl transferase AbiEii/AbiGii toxin family protein [Caldilineaceae bacterium]